MLAAWIRAPRAQFFTASIMPVLATAALVHWRRQPIDGGELALVLLGIVLLHAAANLLNDYFDHLWGADIANRQFISPFTGGSRVIQDGLLQPGQILFAGLLCLAAGSAVGLWLAFNNGWPVLALGLFGAATLFFYTAPPIALAGRGLGEIVIALDFGILPVLGTEFVLTGRMTASALALSIPIALYITAVLWINEFPDAEPDALVGKAHLVARLGLPAAARALVGIYLTAAIALAASVALLLLPAGALWGFVGLVPAALASAALTESPFSPEAWRRACPAGVLAHLLLCLGLTVGLLASHPPLS